ncbi:hypothetical protein ACTXT7_007450 [Hymenolepis weldensis]
MGSSERRVLNCNNKPQFKLEAADCSVFSIVKSAKLGWAIVEQIPVEATYRRWDRAPINAAQGHSLEMRNLHPSGNL